MRLRAHAMATGLQRRLLVLLILPLSVLAAINAWFDYRSASAAAAQLDGQLASLLPLLADSVLSPGLEAGDPPVLLMAPPLDEFLKQGEGFTAYAIADASGRTLHGEVWLAGSEPEGQTPEFHSEEYNGVVYRVAAQRVDTPAGELIMSLADGSDPRQQWIPAVFYRVLLPNTVLILAAALAVSWAVRRALRPLRVLTEAVENRSPRDLTALDADHSPVEVRPLVEAPNRLFGLVNAQAESQRRFVADAAHQLRTPIAGLQSQVEAWAQAADAAPGGELALAAEELHKLRGATRRTSQLANQLLALSRADVRMLAAQPLQRVDLKLLCEALLEAQLDAAAHKNIDLGLETQPAHVMGQQWLLRELLANLVDNAVKYTPSGGTVTLRCGMTTPGDGRDGPADGGAPFLEVEDDGPGIPPSERAHVLERFYRSPGSAGEGNGLGLAIADEIANTHQSHLLLADGGGGRGLRVTLVFAQRYAI